jgi:hypothetical protein
MGYEIHFKYYNKKENSFDYDCDNPQILKKVYGKIDEDYPIEKLMSHVNTQYARRDILVFDADIYEFVRKKITFKQTKNGFNLKNKKFTIKNDPIFDYEDEDTDTAPDVPELGHKHLPEHHPVAPPQPDLVPRPAPAVQQTNINLASAPPPPKQKRVIKTVVFAPLTAEARQKFPYKFTIDKRYPVFSEKLIMNGVGLIIETVDDLGNTVHVNDELFVSDDINLIGDSEVDFSSRSKSSVDNRLNWSGVVKDGSVPKLR